MNAFEIGVSLNASDVIKRFNEHIFLNEILTSLEIENYSN